MTKPNWLKELKGIATSQKTIRTSRLLPILKEIENMYNTQGKTIHDLKQDNKKMSNALQRMKQRKEKKLRKEMNN